MSTFVPSVRRFATLPSTNSEAMRQALAGVDEGLVIVASEQTAGRGRLDRKWVSPAGAGLYFSIVLRPLAEPGSWSLLPLLAAIAVNDALFEACQLETDIKWPNDLIAGERKICGILAEAIETEKGRAVVVGIGINLTKEAFPPNLNEVAISVEEATTKRPDREVLLAALLRAFSSWYLLLQQSGGQQQILEAWTSRSSFAKGKRVKVTNGNEVITGITGGVESDGALRVETETEGVRIIRAGDVTSLRTSV